MRNLLLPPINRQGAVKPPSASTAPWYKIVNKKKDDVTKVYLYDAIGGWFGVEVNDFIKELNDIESSEIHLHINSPGGNVYDGIAIYNSLRQHDAEVTTYVDALAASAASFIAMAGEKVIMARNATMMIHDAIGICMGNMQDMQDTAEILDKVSNNIADIYAFNAGGETDEWRALMIAETWYSAQEAVDAGLADEMLDADSDEEDEDAEETENKWDLSKIFNYAGREAAPSPKQLREKVRNQLKEASMGKTAPKNTEGSQPNEEQTPATEPAKEQTTTPPAEETAPEQTTPAPAPESPTTENKAGTSLLVNGARTTDLAAVQSHINSLETFRSETIENSRIEFVENLARQNKIAATQVGDKAENDKPATGLIAFALSLSDEQFSGWKASFDSAPSQPLFAKHGIEPGDQFAPTNTGSESVQARIADLEQIIADHRRSGMSQEKIEAKGSYKELQALKSQLNNA